MTPKAFIAYAEQEFKPAFTMFGLIPKDKLTWAPQDNMFPMYALISHLSARTGVYGIVKGDWSPEKCWADGDDPKSITPEKAGERLRRALDEVKTLLSGVRQKDWETKEVVTPWGDKGTMEVMSHGLIVGHFLHHKMQLFIYLKLLGLPVDTGVLYLGLPPGKVTM